MVHTCKLSKGDGGLFQTPLTKANFRKYCAGNLLRMDLNRRPLKGNLYLTHTYMSYLYLIAAAAAHSKHMCDCVKRDETHKTLIVTKLGKCKVCLIYWVKSTVCALCDGMRLCNTVLLLIIFINLHQITFDKPLVIRLLGLDVIWQHYIFSILLQSACIV